MRCDKTLHRTRSSIASWCQWHCKQVRLLCLKTTNSKPLRNVSVSIPLPKQVHMYICVNTYFFRDDFFLDSFWKANFGSLKACLMIEFMSFNHLNFVIMVVIPESIFYSVLVLYSVFPWHAFHSQYINVRVPSSGFKVGPGRAADYIIYK